MRFFMDIGKLIKQFREQKGLTQDELAKHIKTTRQTIFKYENGIVTNIPMDKLVIIAKVLDVSPAFLMGWESSNPTNAYRVNNISPICTQKVPMLGEIACGQPIFANEEREVYAEIGTDVKADFCLTARGDSMTGARIFDGDLVFCRSQSSVDNGEIAAVIIGEEATLKRVYYYPEKGKLVLQAENPRYEPLVFVNSELNEITIIGKAIAFQSDIR